MTLKAVCFDLDDTLYPYAEYARAGFLAAADRLAELTGTRLHDELLALYFEEGATEDTFDVLLERHGLDATLTPALVEAYHASTGPLVTYPETRGVLSELGTSHRLGLITDGRGGDSKLDRLDLRGYFDAVLVNYPLGLTKHEPEPFEHVLDTLGVAPEHAVYVGDDPRVDFLVPNRLGMRTVRVRRGRYDDLEPAGPEAAPTAEVRDLDELFAVLSGPKGTVR
jgi:putative hydrolase of the HAD superfamily